MSGTTPNESLCTSGSGSTPGKWWCGDPGLAYLLTALTPRPLPCGEISACSLKRLGSALLSLGDEAQRHAVVTPALPSGRRTVVEHVPVVTAAAHTVVLCARP